MREEQIPMEPAELLMMTPAQTEQQDHYGTAVPKKVKKDRTGLIVCLGLLCVLLATALAAIGLAHLRLEFSSGRLSLRPAPPAQQKEGIPAEQELLPNADARPDTRTHSEDQAEVSLRLDGQTDFGTELPVQELYAAASQSVVCVTAEGFGGKRTGTGIILDENGYVLTTSDAVSGATEITLIRQDGTADAAQLIGTDRTTGFALLHCASDALIPAHFGQTSSLRVGDTVYCIGNPYGDQLRNVLSEGLLSGLWSSQVAGQTLELMSSSAVFGAGNNGCPLLDTAGNVIGVTSSVGSLLTGSGGDPCFAVGAADVLNIAQDILNDSKTQENRWLGFDAAEIPQTYLAYYGFPGTLWITAVGTDTYADGALNDYDVILSVNGIPVGTAEEYEQVLASYALGDILELRIFRGGFYYKIQLPLTAK